jgi:hypothetical protein
MEHPEIILDHEGPKVIPSVYLKRSLILLRIYAGEVSLFVLFGFGKIFLETSLFSDIIAGIVGLGLIAIFAISPLGLFYSFKAFRKKEGNSSVRVWHLIGHLLVFAVVGLLISFYIVSLP